MPKEKRLISLDGALKATYEEVYWTESEAAAMRSFLVQQPTVDAVEVVRCKNCRWAKPYVRNDGETGYYCHFCGHSFKYGGNWERLFTPIKESDDFCSYGERRSYV